ncbi:hypothetical protein C7972_112112 [Arenibacter sp. ARW7G5Y1]|nr:hypothetical protein C7972_112112 [Arenibacter sp. ARW7G5Y1]
MNKTKPQVQEYIIRKITSHELNKPAFRQAGEKTLLS